MVKKVIIIIYKEMERFEYEKYGGTIFEKYFDVEVWDLSKIFLGDKLKVNESFPLQKKIESIKQFVMWLRNNNSKKTFLIFLSIPSARMTFYLQTIVSIMGFSYSMTYLQPCLARWNNGSTKEYWQKRKPDCINTVLNTLFPPRYNFMATTTCYQEFPSVWSIKHQNNILIHTLDYDVYLKIKDESNRIIQGKYILFIDENYVANKIWKILDVDPPFKNSEDYYGPVRQFFDRIERLYGYQIVIAGHPRVRYLDRKIYGNRSIIYDQTARLIRDAELILCHKSIALDYIILFQKKFLVFYLDEFMHFYQWESYYIPLFNYLKIHGLNISRPYNNEMIKDMVVLSQTKECKKYTQYYIKAKGTEEAPFFEIVSEYIRRLE